MKPVPSPAHPSQDVDSEELSLFEGKLRMHLITPQAPGQAMLQSVACTAQTCAAAATPRRLNPCI
jgi:hypothetical protein